MEKGQAEPKHLEILARGVEAWNAWRRQHPDVVPDLRNVDLRGKKLRKADFRNANLRGANLYGAYLPNADLMVADLRFAYLSEVELTNADLSHANLADADLTDSDLTNAKLDQANLEGATLHGAAITRASLFKANLHGADLSRANLNDAELTEARLFGASLLGASLSGANLAGASLSRAYLSRADLIYAHLNQANLSRAYLSRASLFGADLSQACLKNADLRQADLSNTKLCKTQFSNTKIGQTNLSSGALTEAEGLDTIQHAGPSAIGPRALEDARGQLSEQFLKGCGFKDWEILATRIHDPDLRQDEVVDIAYRIVDLRTQSPIQTNSIFFSYSRKDAAFVEQIEKRFDRDGIRSWRDVRDMSAGPIEPQLERAINLNGTVLLVLSKHSVDSDWVQWEVKKARQLQNQLQKEEHRQSHVLCPVALDDSWKTCRWPERLKDQVLEYHLLDCSDWKEPSFDAKYDKLKINLGIYYFNKARTIRTEEEATQRVKDLS